MHARQHHYMTCKTIQSLQDCMCTEFCHQTDLLLTRHVVLLLPQMLLSIIRQVQAFMAPRYVPWFWYIPDSVSVEAVGPVWGIRALSRALC